MVKLGLLYEQGYGVTRDYAKARDWYEKAAAKDDAKGMMSLGILYERGGYGVTQDYAKARDWYEKAKAAFARAGVLKPPRATSQPPRTP